MKRLNVLFFWHMHQPSYNIHDEPYFLPWTRLHGTKDYYGMARVIQSNPAFRMTVNFTPVLLEQLVHYGKDALDRELELTLKPPTSLTLTERQFLLEKMFTGNPVSLINPFPRYAELYDQFSRGGEDAASRMTEMDISDLTVWRILAWIYPEFREQNDFIRELMERGSGFSMEEKTKLISETRQLIAGIPDQYADLASSGQIELTSTPYYHPILPVLIDSEAARESHPGVSLPPQFSFYDDAEWHVSQALKLHKEVFKNTPVGMWPAEGSVSRDAAALFAQNGINWIASDEEILGKSLGIHLQRSQPGMIDRPDLLYRGWEVQTESGPVNMIFRDHYLSDLLGFDYQSLPIERAVSDFIRYLHIVSDRCARFDFEPCVPIILDGENAWEHYENGGFEFLEALFTGICKEERFELTTVSDYFKKPGSTPGVLPSLTPGSWINGNFDIWIGQNEENLAWTCIHDLHDALGETMAKHPEMDYSDALKMLRKSQASDTFWWFGDDHFTTEKADFDLLFRKILIKGYEYGGLEPPSNLYNPLISFIATESPVSYPKNLISPVVDGEIRSYFDWFGAGNVGPESRMSAMHNVSSEQVLKQIHFGFNTSRLFLRFDPTDAYLSSTEKESLKVDVVFSGPDAARDFLVNVEFRSDRFTNGKRSGVADCQLVGIDGSPLSGEVLFREILEVGIDFSELGIQPDEKLSFHFEIWLNQKLWARIPDHSEIEFFAPTSDYDSLMWRV